MNKKIKDALNLRISLFNYVSIANRIDKSVYGIELKHYFPGFKQIDEFAMWKEWQEFVNDFMSKKDSIPNNKMMNLIQKTQDELKLLFKRTIVEALAEILILELDVDVIEIYIAGIRRRYSPCGSYQSDDRYHIPDSIANILREEYPILTKELVSDVSEEFRAENISEYLRFDNWSSQIAIPVLKRP